MLRTIKLKTFLPVLSAALLVLSFPDFNFEFLAWIGFVPLFFAIENKKPVKAFVISYITGIIFFLGTIYWLIHVTLPGMLIVVLYLALYFGLFGLACSHYFKTPKTYMLLLLVPSVWTALELVRSHFITGFGWNLLGYSQSFTLPVIQIADLTGPYGVSFLVMLVNIAVYITIKELRKKNYYLKAAAIALLVVFAALYYGTMRVRNVFTGEKVFVAVVQGNIPQVKKWDPSFRETIMNKYERLTREAALRHPELIIWPETSVPGFMESEPDLFDRVTSLAREIKIPILAGSPREDPAIKDAYYNSAIFIDENGKIAGRYDKSHLVPFGEYVPLRALLSFVENFAPSPIGDFSAGKNYTVFDFFIKRSAKDKDRTLHLIKKARFSALICFEDIFPDLARRFVSAGANFLVNITNDAWFGKTCAAYQHAQSSVFRAVENRVNVVRAANTGVSCFIDQKGAMVGGVGSEKGSTFVEGYAIREITLTKTRTFYNVYGDLFAYICVFIAFGYFLITLRGKKWNV
ncbi:MAG: apolipoprotein N-acyltransferase [Candidatus Omnitrophica bacterium]|nr:apolipoprotein N-acyltransferase [Candidatus Omnitrophota bacterium]